MNSQLRHIVIIVKENHTFDNYFGTFPGANGAALSKVANPPPDDPNHRHQAWMQRQNDTVHRVQYNKADIPAYFAFANQFTLCDAASNGMSDCFDFAQQPLAPPGSAGGAGP